MKALRVIVIILVVGVGGFLIYQALEARKTADLNNQAIILLNGDKFGEARDLLERARLNDPDNPSIWRNLGVAYEGLKDVPKAIEAFEHSLALKPGQPDIRENLEVLKRSVELGGQPPAKTEAAPAGKSAGKPTEAEISAQVGMTYENMGDDARAIQMFEQSLQLDPNQPEIRKRLDALKKK